MGTDFEIRQIQVSTCRICFWFSDLKSIPKYSSTFMNIDWKKCTWPKFWKILESKARNKNKNPNDQTTLYFWYYYIHIYYFMQSNVWNCEQKKQEIKNIIYTHRHRQFVFTCRNAKSRSCSIRAKVRNLPIFNSFYSHTLYHKFCFFFFRFIFFQNF